MRTGRYRGRGIGSTRWIPLGAAIVRLGTTIRRSIDRPVAAMVVVGVLLLAGGWIAPAALRPHGDGAVYSVVQLRADLRRAPRRLLEETVRVRGVLQSEATFPCAFTGGPCIAAETRLTGSGRESAVGFPVVLEPAGPLVTWLRRLPLVHVVSPVPQALRWGTIGTYWVRVHRAPGTAAGARLIVSDVDPQSP